MTGASSARERVWSARAAAVLTRRRIGRAVMVAAVVAAITCVVGAVVAWQLLGDLRTRSATSLQLLERTLVNVDDTLAVAQDVTATVGSALDTLDQSLITLATGVENGATALGAVADLTEDIPPALDRLDATLATLRNGGAIVDGALNAIDQLPIGPDLADAGLADSVEQIRADLRPISEDLQSSTTSIRDLSTSSAELVTQIEGLGTDIAELDRSLERSTALIDRYRADAAEALTLAEDSLDDLERDITLSRILAVVLALAIAVGQVAPFHIGRQLARGADVVEPAEAADIVQPTNPTHPQGAASER